MATFRQLSGETNHERHKCTHRIKLLHDQGKLRRVDQIGGAGTEGARHRHIVSASRCSTSAAASRAAAAGRPRHYCEKHTEAGDPVKQPPTPLTTPAAEQHQPRQARECQPQCKPVADRWQTGRRQICRCSCGRHCDRDRCGSGAVERDRARRDRARGLCRRSATGKRHGLVESASGRDRNRVVRGLSGSDCRSRCRGRSQGWSR